MGTRGSGTAWTYKTYGTYGMSRRDCGSMFRNSRSFSDFAPSSETLGASSDKPLVD
jgi:hypothetical protein